MGTSYFSAVILYAILLNAQSSLANSAAGTTNGTIPAPVIIPPTQYWEGNDGPWSSFQLRVGTPAQYPRVLISTAAYNTWIVIPQAGCDVGCANSRGTLFNPNQSTSWRDKGLYILDLELNLNYSTNGDYGLDRLGLGLQETSGPTLDSQVVAGFQNNAYYYLGVLGLTPYPTNFTTFNEGQPSFLTTLKTKNLIPSLSWSYTAGARYRLKQVLGSAILGGYDRSRFVPNDLSFSFAPDISRDLVVGLQSIKSVDGNGRITSLLPSGILTFVDSTIPYIWLPSEAYSAFEKEFGLTWDASSELYLVNDSLHNTLVARKLNFTFQLGNFATGGPNVNITLPYASFALTASSPLVSNTTKYFPLKRAANDTQYTLGRAFLQEAYLIADYERSNFSISQCQWQEGLKQDVVAIRSINSTDTTTTNPSADPSPHLGAGAIAGIAVAGVLLLLLAGVIAYAFAKRKWPFNRLRQPQSEAARPGKDTDNISDKVEMDAHLSERVEMESPRGGKEMPGCSPKYMPTTPLGELQGSPTPPPAAHEMMDPSIYQELPASPVPTDYFAGGRVSRKSSRQSPLRRQLSADKGGQDSLPISPLPSPIPSPPPPAVIAEPISRFSRPTPNPVPRTPSKPQQRPFQLNLPHGSAPGSPVNANAQPVPSIAVHAPEPPSENSTLQQTPIRMKWKPADYSGDDYHSDRE